VHSPRRSGRPPATLDGDSRRIMLPMASTLRTARAERRLRRLRPWFAAAAVYNIAWGAIAALVPDALLAPLGVGPAPLAWRVVGLLVATYALAYGWIALDPIAHRHLVLIGVIGKLGGATGLALGITTGLVPVGYVWIVAANDVVWLPAFLVAAACAANVSGGWRPYLLGR
jgi:hypothetical protein